MGKAWKFGTGWGVLAVGALISYFSNAPNSNLFIIFTILASLSVICFLVYFLLLTKKRIKPLDFLDDIHCTYWPKEKQVGVTFWICDYSNSPEFKATCNVKFENQVIKVNPKTLDGTYCGNTYCRGGRKRMVEFLKNDVEVAEPNRCLITLAMKPLGIWATKRKTKEVDTLIVSH